MKPITLIAALCIGSLPGARAAEVTLPVTRVTAFSSGVAYFEHNGRVTGDAEVLLKARTEGVNDMLKSLTVMDLGGGAVVHHRERLVHVVDAHGAGHEEHHGSHLYPS
ncbi:MAG: hypothetical protein HY321_19490, partial [Armatimonadetes bacterium]|nr:hypothetical protein [Armatimonadota bacterium]